MVRNFNIISTFRFYLTNIIMYHLNIWVIMHIFSFIYSLYKDLQF